MSEVKRFNNECESILEDNNIEWNDSDDCYCFLFDAYSSFDPYFGSEVEDSELLKILKDVEIVFRSNKDEIELIENNIKYHNDITKRLEKDLRKIFDYYREPTQLAKMKEELEELLWEIDHPALSTKSNFINELGDNIVMCLQFAIKYPEVWDVVKFKINRQLGRMEKEKGKIFSDDDVEKMLQLKQDKG